MITQVMVDDFGKHTKPFFDYAKSISLKKVTNSYKRLHISSVNFCACVAIGGFLILDFVPRDSGAEGVQIFKKTSCKLRQGFIAFL